MKIPNRAAVFNFRKILFGRTHAYSPWVRETFDVPTIDGDIQEAVHYEGPGFDPLWPDDFITPAEDVQSLHEFSFVIRKVRVAPDDLLRGEGTLYQNITENWDSIVAVSSSRRRRDLRDDRVKQEKDIAEGVLYEGNLSAAHCLTMYEWYGKWRKLKGKDAAEGNTAAREKFESDIVIRYLPDLNLVVGVQDLAQMYPAKKNRRPFVEASLCKDGSYWSAGFGELLEAAERELTANHNMASRAGKFSRRPCHSVRPSLRIRP